MKLKIKIKMIFFWKTESDELNHIEKLKDASSFNLCTFEITIHYKVSGEFDIVQGNSNLNEMRTKKRKTGQNLTLKCRRKLCGKLIEMFWCIL